MQNHGGHLHAGLLTPGLGPLQHRHGHGRHCVCRALHRGQGALFRAAGFSVGGLGPYRGPFLGHVCITARALCSGGEGWGLGEVALPGS